MGVVYRAQDTRLNRPVALKMLPADAAADPARMGRFLHEARAASALNHPNIITVHDIGTAEGVTFIAMEFVAGRTLADLVAHNRLTLADALKYAIQIADAVSAAHAAGLVHRDLKPANVMVTDAGRVKVLDFGLAKSTERGSIHDAAVTQTSDDSLRPRTEEGSILGTVAYMSPEQAEGKPVDTRSDIFAFGALLYELVTGRRAFQGESKVGTLSAILHAEPQPASTIASNTPRELDRIIAHCLRKDPARRFQHLDDVKTLLEQLKEESESGALSLAQAVAAKRRTRSMPWIGLAAGIATVAGAAWWVTTTREPKSMRASPPTRLTFDSGLTTEPVLSPDGRHVVYASDRAGTDNLDIWVQNIAGGAATRLTSDIADEREPAFSPDGSRIAFRSDKEGGGIYVMSSFGGDQRLIAKGGRRPRFSPDGNWIAYYTGERDVQTAPAGELHVVASTGGVHRRIDLPAEIRGSHPVWAPDGRHLLFLGFRGARELDWWVIPVEGGKAVRTAVFEAFRRVNMLVAGDDITIPEADQWLEDRIVFSGQVGASRSVWQVRLSPDTWQVVGGPEQLTSGTSFEGQASIVATIDERSGRSERLVFASSTSTINVWSLPIAANVGKVSGEPQRLTSSAYDGQSSLSDDGRRLAFVSSRSGNLDIWLKDLESGKETALTAGRVDEFGPEISADGNRVYYQVIEGGDWRVEVVPLGPQGEPGVPRKVCSKCTRLWEPSSDGQRLAFIYATTPRLTAGLLDLATGRRVELLSHERYSLARLRFSPDDRWISLIAIDSQARSRVYIVPLRTQADRPVAGAEAEWVAITEEDTFHDKPVWSPDGTLLYFTSDRDGYRCIFARRLNRDTKRPEGAPFAVYHSHSARRSVRNADILKQELAVAPGRMVFQLAELTGNIWMSSLSAP